MTTRAKSRRNGRKHPAQRTGGSRTPAADRSARTPAGGRRPRRRAQPGIEVELSIRETTEAGGDSAGCRMRLPANGAAALVRSHERRARGDTIEVWRVLGHAHRMRILGKLLAGPATYRSLQKATKLQAGPLYHHIAQLRLAGLILPKQRDLYELSRGGRNLVAIAHAAGKLVRDARRRPE